MIERVLRCDLHAVEYPNGATCPRCAEPSGPVDLSGGSLTAGPVDLSRGSPTVTVSRSSLAAPVVVFTCPDCGSDQFVFRHRIHIVNGYHVPQWASGVPVCECGWTDHRERPIYPGDLITGAAEPRPIPGDPHGRP